MEKELSSRVVNVNVRVTTNMSISSRRLLGNDSNGADSRTILAAAWSRRLLPDVRVNPTDKRLPSGSIVMVRVTLP